MTKRRERISTKHCSQLLPFGTHRHHQRQANYSEVTVAIILRLYNNLKIRAN